MASKASTGVRSTTTVYNPSPVSPVHFAEAMRAHWATLGNASSEKLIELWRGMGSAFSRAILLGAGSMKGKPGEEHRWQVLQPPAGTGKTQGACVYAAMVAKANRKLSEAQDRTGILFVTRLIEEADKLAETINALAGFKCTIARHSNNRVPAGEVAQHDVLVITHQAYANALEDAVLRHGEDRLEDFLLWEAGPRFLTIIDESLANLVASYQATEEDFRIVSSYFDRHIAGEFEPLVDDFKKMALALNRTEALFEEFEAPMTEAKRLWSGPRNNLDWYVHRQSLPALRRRMSRLRYDHLIKGSNDASLKMSVASRVDRALKAYEAFNLGAAYRSGKAGVFAVHASRLLLPEELHGPVILDATAEQEPIWGLLGHRVQIADKVDGVRNYRNVRLHVARADAVGKSSMAEHAETRLPRLLDNLREGLQERRVFLCLHKDLEPLATSYDTPFKDYAVDHWGNVDGRNDWQDYDAAILFGLFYRPDTWAINMMQAVHQVRQAGETLSIGAHQKQREIKQTLQNRQIAASVIQAINRIRCRRVIDSEGNCAEADVYIVLPRNKLGDDVLSRVTSEMPGIQAMQWEFDLDGMSRAVPKAHYATPVTRYMENHPSGEVDLRTLCTELPLRKNARKDMQKDLKDPDNPFTKSLADAGITYHSVGRGRAARSFLLKR